MTDLPLRNTKSIRGVRVVDRRRGKKFCYYVPWEFYVKANPDDYDVRVISHLALLLKEEIDRQLINDIVEATSEMYDLDYAK